jgi:nitrite reductase (NADH) small subunit
MAAARKLGPPERIPLGEGKAFEVDGQRVAVFRARSGELYATQAECPHRGGPLADGVVGGSIVVCPLHAAKFDLKTGQPIGGSCAALKIFPVELDEDGQMVLVTGDR